MTLFQTMMVQLLLVSGMSLALLGSVKVPLARRLQIDEARVGGLVSLFGFAMIPVIFSAGFLTDLAGKGIVLMAGSIGLAASIVWLALSQSYRSALAAVVLLSASWSLLINVGNVLTPAAFPGDMAYSTNLANVFFGLGAFLTPLLATYLLNRTSLTATLGLLAVSAAVPAVLAIGVDFEAVTTGAADGGSSATEETGFAALLTDPTMWLCGFALFFYGPLEASVAAWTTTYLGERGISESRAAGFLSAFWLSFMSARLLTAFTLPKNAETILILSLGLACIGVMVAMVVGRSGAAAAAAVIGAGLVFGPIFPTILAVLFGHFPPALRGRAVGLLFAIGGIGWTVIPLLIGAYARRTSVQRGFAVAIGAAVGLTGVALLLAARHA